MTEATKNDQDKPRMELLPPKALRGAAVVFGYGAKPPKYSEFNYKLGKGLDWGRVFAAIQRHLNSWNDGEELDKESGYPHLWHALCGMMMLDDLVESGMGKDTRFKK